jgi:hypothetical protein
MPLIDKVLLIGERRKKALCQFRIRLAVVLKSEVITSPTHAAISSFEERWRISLSSGQIIQSYSSSGTPAPIASHSSSRLRMTLSASRASLRSERFSLEPSDTPSVSPSGRPSASGS